MTTEAEPNTNTTAAEVDLQVGAVAIPSKTTTGKTTMDTDKVSAALSDYMLKGWVCGISIAVQTLYVQRIDHGLNKACIPPSHRQC